ncbi:ABC transporter ATP-binding protein [Vallitalea longa]|uniref:ABC transporter ATP-binding protein n=1 Tax=Vallitalea longa TaxID=2936439 RepID=A0A9W5Y7K7_9FIRM|nr:ATP-binding cassette domain-containing protein [Vallitalea longa]GKX28360.1 ABC transporter ATP-binding protein [Vallitalea longa]
MINLKNISKKYGETYILEGFSYEFKNHGITCLLGASGSGKSTLFNLLAGFDRDYTGEIIVESKDISEFSEIQLSNYRKDSIGFVFQEYNLILGYTVIENIMLAAELYLNDENENRKSALNLLEILGIKEKAYEKIENLSGGQKQRVAIARALVGNPSVILADEPTGALDRKTANEIMRIFSGIAKERPVIMITHDNKICDFADEIITIEDGKCKCIKSIEDRENDGNKKVFNKRSITPSMKKRAALNFKAHFKKFVGVAFAVTIVISAVLMSFSSQNIINAKIDQFEQKNTAFAWGQIHLNNERKPDKLLSLLENNPQIENHYLQYTVPESTIVLGDTKVELPSKSFGNIATETINRGTMPKDGEIAISPSLAKKLAFDMTTLIGQEIIFSSGEFTEKLIISGLFNNSLDDYYLGSNVEEKFYSTLKNIENPVSVIYKVKTFHKVLEVEKFLLENEFEPKTASNQVESLSITFEKLKMLFNMVTVLIVSISIFICVILLMKISGIRAKEIGILMALGYSIVQIRKMLLYESIKLSILSAITTIFVVSLLTVFSEIIFTKTIISLLQVIFAICCTFIIVWQTNTILNSKLLKTDPVIVLKK